MAGRIGCAHVKPTTFQTYFSWRYPVPLSNKAQPHSIETGIPVCISVWAYPQPPYVFWKARSPPKLKTSCSNLSFTPPNTTALLQVVVCVNVRPLWQGPVKTGKPEYTAPRETIITVTGAQQQIGKGSIVVSISYRVGWDTETSRVFCLWLKTGDYTHK